MSREIFGDYKRTERRERTRVTLFLRPEHPVSKGLYKAEQMLGGSFPEHVREIRVKPDLVRRSFPEEGVVCGRCFWRDNGTSKIEIYAGSILMLDGGFENSDYESCMTVLHEVGHSWQNKDYVDMGWYESGASKFWYEEDAERFVNQAVRKSSDYEFTEADHELQRRLRVAMEKAEAGR